MRGEEGLVDPARPADWLCEKRPKLCVSDLLVEVWSEMPKTKYMMA